MKGVIRERQHGTVFFQYMLNVYYVGKPLLVHASLNLSHRVWFNHVPAAWSFAHWTATNDGTCSTSSKKVFLSLSISLSPCLSRSTLRGAKIQSIKYRQERSHNGEPFLTLAVRRWIIKSVWNLHLASQCSDHWWEKTICSHGPQL